MTHQEIFQKIETIALRIFGEKSTITESTAPSDVEKWDSLNHVLLIAAIEEEFTVKFDILEIVEVSSIGQFVNLVEKKLG